MSISVIIPVLNEEKNVEPLIKELDAVLQEIGRPYEIICVNDGSLDRTGEILDQLETSYPKLRCIHLRRPFGQTAALRAGLESARGELIVTMDGDLQNDPHDLPEMLKLIDQGHDVVSGWRHNRQDDSLRVNVSRIANWFVSRVLGTRLHDF